jgi:uncharacterized protein YkwD
MAIIKNFSKTSVFNKCQTDFQKKALEIHNSLREKHESTPNLEWDETIQFDAQIYADILAEKNNGIDQSYSNIYSENIDILSNTEINTLNDCESKYFYLFILFWFF